MRRLFLSSLGRPSALAILVSESGRQEGVLLALKAEEKVMSHAMQAASRNWERQRNGFSPRKNAALPTP